MENGTRKQLKLRLIMTAFGLALQVGSFILLGIHYGWWLPVLISFMFWAHNIDKHV